IAANPPYLRSGDMPGLAPEVRREPALALDGGPDGLDLIARIIAGAGDFLRPGGTLLIEADPEQMPAIAGMLDAAGFGGICARQDLGGRERVIGAGFGGLDRGCRDLPLPA
ncbi:MAG: peptide chain release factor N(5)-glutamine methyltransferase, partial [Treponema sp.]|nr:peptide chain release factor N(5)-glutamine methyltransferase [Treponema sp.]